MKNKQEEIFYSAPAKVILSGEHAVVYGKPGLVSAIDMRLKFGVKTSQKTIEDETINMLLKTAINELESSKIPYRMKNFEFQITSNIPIGQRLGSSAAFCVAGSAALIHWLTGQLPSREIINNCAYQAEKYFHQNSSGVDTSTSCFGGLIYYRKEFEFLRNISSLSFKIPKNIHDGLYLIDSGLPEENTGEMVSKVKELYNSKPKSINGVLNELERVTKKLTVSIIKKDFRLFTESIADNQILLEKLEVVSDKARQMLGGLARFGQGKVCGGGGRRKGSGYLLFCTQQNKELENYLYDQNIKYYKFEQSHEGVRNEID